MGQSNQITDTVHYTDSDEVRRNLEPITYLQSARFWVCASWHDGKEPTASGYWLTGKEFARLIGATQDATEYAQPELMHVRVMH